MTTLNYNPAAHKNAGIAVEWGLCRVFGIERKAHDHSDYKSDSDINYGDMHISVKASGFTLMSGSLCEGKTSFDDIWALYSENVHSNTFAYGTKDGKAYLMNLDEFKTFVYEFCGTEKESEKNGGMMKIRCRKESKKMLKWLEERV